MDVWDGSEWLSTNQENYTYDENLNLDTLLVQYWNGIEWINTFRAFHTWSPVTYIEGEDLSSIANLYSLDQNYPNPFNPITTISYQLPILGFTTLKVYDVLGNEIAVLVNEIQNAGGYNVQFNASELASGIYFYELNSGSFAAISKMILLK